MCGLDAKICEYYSSRPCTVVENTKHLRQNCRHAWSRGRVILLILVNVLLRAHIRDAIRIASTPRPTIITFAVTKAAVGTLLSIGGKPCSPRI